MLPFSYQGFGFTAILVMVGILSLGQLVKYLRDRYGRNQLTEKNNHDLIS